MAAGRKSGKGAATTSRKGAKKKAPARKAQTTVPKRAAKPPKKGAAARPAEVRPDAPPASRSVHLPPLPKLVKTTYHWRGLDRLPSWAGLRFYSKWMKRTPRPTDGTVHVLVDTPDGDDREPTASERATYAFLKANEQTITTAVLTRILAEYPEQKQLYEESVDATWPTLPEVSDIAALGAVIGPPTIHIGGDAEGGIGAIGFAFDCAWDEEHQLGLRWHDGEIVEFGDGDVVGFIVA